MAWRLFVVLLQHVYLGLLVLLEGQRQPGQSSWKSGYQLGPVGEEVYSGNNHAMEAE